MLTISKLSSINFPRINPAKGGGADKSPSTGVIDTLITALISGFPQKVLLTDDFLISIFAPAFFADDETPMIFELKEEEEDYWYATRNNIRFGAETGLNGSMVMPIYFQADEYDSEKVFPVNIGMSDYFQKELSVGALVQKYFITKFKDMIVEACINVTPSYKPYQAAAFKNTPVVTIRNSSGSDVLATVRHIFSDLQSDNDATIYDMIVTPVGTNRLVRVHSVDIVPMGYSATQRELDEKRIAESMDKLVYREDVVKELVRMLPKEKVAPYARTNEAQDITGFNESR